MRAIQFGLGLNKWKKVREIIIMICWGLAGRQAGRQTGTVTVQGHRGSASRYTVIGEVISSA